MYIYIYCVVRILYVYVNLSIKQIDTYVLACILTYPDISNHQQPLSPPGGPC